MIEPRPVLEIDGDSISAQLEGYKHLLPEDLKGEFEPTQEFVDLVFENVNAILCDRTSEPFWEKWCEVLTMAVSISLIEIDKKSG